MAEPEHNPRAADPGLARLAGHPADRPGVLLHSGRPHPRWARRSLFAEPRAWYRYTLDRGSELTGAPEVDVAWTHRLWTDLRALLADPRFPGRWFGYIGYDVCRVIEREKLPWPQRRPAAGDWPIVELGWCPQWEPLEPRDEAAPSVEAMAARPGSLRSDFTRGEYEAAVRRVIDYIAAGDVFQVNLAQRFVTDVDRGPRDLFARLAGASPAWYGAHVELPGGRALCSTSPELFLEVTGHDLVTRPIKGTRPVDPAAARPGRDPNREELRQSEKDAAELNMIVDLLRNDLGKVCDYGSVRVVNPREIETHPTVHHGTATIAGRLHESKDIVSLLRATLPGGSITGAPKVRAMQIIDELERADRGPYCGCIGWLSRDAAQLNLAIRTIALTPRDGGGHAMSFHVGGGIVADSDPAAEYEETMTKAQAMLRAL